MARKQFDKATKAIFVLAQQLSEQRKDSYIGPEHYLLAMLCDGNNSAGQVLRSCGIEEQHIIEALKDVSRPKFPMRELLPQVKQALEVAASEAQKSDTLYIKSEHVLLGLLHIEDEPIIERVAGQADTTVEAIDRRVRHSIQPQRRYIPSAASQEAQPGEPLVESLRVYDQFVDGLAGVVERTKRWIKGEKPSGDTPESTNQ